MEITEADRDLAAEMLRLPIAQLPAREWSRQTAIGMRRRLLRMIEDHAERRLITPHYLETL